MIRSKDSDSFICCGNSEVPYVTLIIYYTVNKLPLTFSKAQLLIVDLDIGEETSLCMSIFSTTTKSYTPGAEIVNSEPFTDTTNNTLTRLLSLLCYVTP